MKNRLDALTSEAWHRPDEKNERCAFKGNRSNSLAYSRNSATLTQPRESLRFASCDVRTSHSDLKQERQTKMKSVFVRGEGEEERKEK